MSIEYPRPSLTVDVATFRYRGGHLELLLIERGADPFKGQMALPGGYIDENEAPIDAARRELLEETALSGLPFLEVGVFGDAGRDPRGWVVSTCYIALAPPETEAIAGDDAASVGWFRLSNVQELAFDHEKLVARALMVLRERTQVDTAPLKLLPKSFRTAQARHLYAQIWGAQIDPRTFKAWLRRRRAVNRVGPGRFEAAPCLSPDWLR